VPVGAKRHLVERAPLAVKYWRPAPAQANDITASRTKCGFWEILFILAKIPSSFRTLRSLAPSQLKKKAPGGANYPPALFFSLTAEAPRIAVVGPSRGVRRPPVIRCGHRRVRWRCDRCAEWRRYRAARPGRNARRSPTSRSPVARLRRGARERVRGSC
jgi:hypothetical protein